MDCRKKGAFELGAKQGWSDADRITETRPFFRFLFFLSFFRNDNVRRQTVEDYLVSKRPKAINNYDSKRSGVGDDNVYELIG